MLRRWWRRKTKKDFSNMDTLVTQERVSLQHKGTGDTYSFLIGKTTSGQYFALTDNNQNPKFCFEADDREDAYQKGVDALNFYFESQFNT